MMRKAMAQTNTRSRIKTSGKKDRMFHIPDLLILLGITLFILMDTFVISYTLTGVDEGSDQEMLQSVNASDYAFAESSLDDGEDEISDEVVSDESLSESDGDTSSAVITDTSYEDENISVQIDSYRYEDTTIYVADVTVSSAEYLKTALAYATYGKNVKDTTSGIADSVDAILAINGDFYGARNSGYVLRNGVLYRDSAQSSSQEDLVISSDGDLSIVTEGSVSASELKSQGALQVLSFGPALIENGQISVDENDEVGKAMASNPRTAICQVGPLHYLLVVSDGRTSESEGLSLYELAGFLQDLGVETAYNLDGGGSSTMVFNGTVINNPTTGGNHVKERSVSDIVYIGY